MPIRTFNLKNVCSYKKNIYNYYILFSNMGIRCFMIRFFYELKKVFYLDVLRKITLKRVFMYKLDIFREREYIDVLSVLLDQSLKFKTKTLDSHWSYHDSCQDLIIDIKKIADNACNGSFFSFSRNYFDYGKPVVWNRNPLTSYKYPDRRHYSKINEFVKGEDIKMVWEASRFPYIFYVTKAYLISGDDEYAICFWELFESWVDGNSFELGPNWICGQEVSLRLLSWICSFTIFYKSKHSSATRLKKFIKLLWQHGKRIEQNINYARKVLRNNHAISEAAGLFTIGLTFPFFKESKRWREKGFKYLHEEGLKQFYPDGSYIQHSFNYQRMVLQLYSWCLSLGVKHNISFSEELREKLRRSVQFLYSMQDSDTGYLPNYGANDGALPFPVTNCDYRDYRPQLNAAWYIIAGKRLYEPGMYDEELIWLTCDSDQEVKVEQPAKLSRFDDGGYYILRSNESWGFTRCATYRDRPNQADMLHFDLWWRGQNILIDAGTYSYNDPEWTDYFTSTAAHNTITINNKDQMEKWKRFTWLNWTKSKLIRFEHQKEYSVFEGEHYGYGETIHRRSICCINDTWVIIDDVIGEANEEVVDLRLHWLLGDFILKINEDDRATIKTHKGNMTVHIWGSDDCVKLKNEGGWRSLYYGFKEKVPSLFVKKSTKLPYRFITLIFPENELRKVDIIEARLELKDGSKAISLYLGKIGTTNIIQKISF